MTREEIFRYTDMSETYRIVNNIPIEDPEIESFVLWVTPEMAKDMLMKNKINRIISHVQVIDYMNQIQRGEWQLNGETISFFANGNLKDGQHRLMAIIKSGIAVPCLVVFNIPNNSTIHDRGRQRRVYEALLIDGIDKAYANKNITAIVNLYVMTQASKTGRGAKISEGSLEDFINEHKDALDFLQTIPQTRQNRSAIIRVAALRAYEANEDPERVMDFFNILTSGMVTDAGDSAAIVIRDMIAHGKIMKHGDRAGRVKDEAICEKGIYDFCRHEQRKNAYVATQKRVYFSPEEDI